jgi:hypothetical protein
MSKRIFALSSSIVFAVSLPLAAQTPAALKAASGNTGKPWSLSKTPWGDPDLQGTWTSDDTWGVPMERPVSYGDRLYLTEDELKDREKRVAQSKQRIENPSSDNHSPAKAQLDAEAKGATSAAGARGVDAAPVPGQFGEYARRASKQTSQIVDPPNGRMPPLTPEGKQKQAAAQALRRKTPETWTDWSIYDRCITRGVAGSIIPVVYGNGLEIVQAPGYVAIRYEMVHDARIIPVLDAASAAKAHMPPSIRSYMGDPVGHWEGNTLVVETTNFNDKMGIGPNGGGIAQSEDMKLTERFTRVADNTINYELIVDDPKTYTATWKIAFPITHEPGYQLFEYACHEGNMAMRNMITGTIAEQAAAAAKKN